MYCHRSLGRRLAYVILTSWWHHRFHLDALNLPAFFRSMVDCDAPGISHAEVGRSPGRYNVGCGAAVELWKNVADGRITASSSSA